MCPSSPCSVGSLLVVGLALALRNCRWPILLLTPFWSDTVFPHLTQRPPGLLQSTSVGRRSDNSAPAVYALCWLPSWAVGLAQLCGFVVILMGKRPCFVISIISQDVS